MSVQEIIVEEKDRGIRLDLFLARMLSQGFSRSQVQKLIHEGAVRVGGREVLSHYRVKAGDRITMESGTNAPEETRAEDIPIDIIYEDADLIVVNKPAGMVVHPAHGNPYHTLVNALLFHVQELSKLGSPVRPGIVHRLDKDTSGLLVVAKNEQSHADLSRQFKNHTIERAYQAVVYGVVQHDEGLCEEPVGRAFLNRKKVVVKPSGGKSATTYFRVLRRFRKATLLEVRPKTGRTHQIRVHMKHLGHPVLGDALYGIPSQTIDRQALHAFSLGLCHPRTRQKCYWECPLPDDMKKLIASLEQDQ
ncbi:MAG: RluA family pseudouridine synthase [Candidatus Omnitrophica bacterium]|nr:RluA family pseudouridine synthase [Candidatus Omnitrophota bacterium]